MLAPERLDAILAACRDAPCIAALRLRHVESDEGYCKLTAPIDPAFRGLLPGFHGGMLAMVADCAAWFAIATQTGPTEPLLTTDLDIRYLAPCNTAVTAAARIIKLGKTLCPVRIDMSDDEGRCVATGIVTYIRTSSLAAR